MAQSRRKKKPVWWKRFLVFVVMPFFVWFAAFLLWFNWSSIERLFTKSNERAPVKAPIGRDAGEPTEKGTGRNTSEATRPSESRPKEKILEEDRKSLEDVLKRQQR